jgi:DNA-binding CsgD family transcriptional regulator/tetratricopeptide (TPR) repeat protein
VKPGILEREAELAVLAAAVRDAAAGSGSVVLISGEAGIGKSSLVEAVRSQLPAEGRMLAGYCDDLATPRTLGPFRDLVGSVGTELSQAVTDGSDRDRLLAALRAELDWADHPAALVIEDVHWADDATLDALRYLVRRIARLPAVLILTYRDDELGREHALHSLLGQASRSDRVRRLPLHRLSAGAVRQLSGDSPLDADEVFELTSGNPFFVHELLVSAPDEQVPPSVADAVLARVRQLDPVTQDVLEQLAVVPAALEPWLAAALMEGVAPDATAVLALAEQRGLLTVSGRRITFRHELTRRAIAGAVPSARLIALNQRVLTALTGRPGADVAQIVHHAAQAGDVDALVAYGPDAARDAARAGARREAAAHYRLVLEHAGRFAPAERAALLQEYGIECYTLGAADAAVEVQQQAVELNRRPGNPGRLGASLRWLSRMSWWAGDRRSAERAGREAVQVLEESGDRRLLALALSNLSQLEMLAHRPAAAIGYGQRAVALAREVGDAAITSHALTNIGSSQWYLGDPAAQQTMDEALRVALEAGDTEDACRAYVNITWHLLDWFRLDEAERYLTAAMKLAGDDEFLGFLAYMQVEQARLALARGEWEEAVRHAEPVVDGPAPTKCAALTLLARIRIRRGEPGAADLLGPAWEIAVQVDEMQRLGPVAAARAEDAWLRGDLAAVRDIVTPVHAEAERLNDANHLPELGYWMATAGQTASGGTPAATAAAVLPDAPVVPGAPAAAAASAAAAAPVLTGAPAVADAPDADDGSGAAGAHPYTLQAAGRWRDAAAAWAAAGCPYERAAALAESPDPADLLTALALLDDLDARPLASVLRGRLKSLGVTRIPRGPLEETRANPAGLTARQIDVLRLLAQGHSNAQIARQLVVSVRTVDSHVAALLGKLGAHDRHDAAARAAELGMLASPES